MFQEDYGLERSSTAGVRIKEMTMSDKSTFFSLIHQMMACNIASF